VFIIDFVNDPNSIQAAFAQYDSGAKIEQVQDLNVIYDMKDKLDSEGIYDDSRVHQFRIARYQTAAAFNADGDTEHKAMFAATQEPTDTYNARLKHLRALAQAAEDAYEKAHIDDNADGMKKADHERKQIAEAIGHLTEFKAGLARFARTYSYIAQALLHYSRLRRDWPLPH